MSRAIEQPEKSSYLQVLFTYGDPAAPDQIGFTDFASDQGIYLSAPTLEVDLPANMGQFSDNKVAIKMPLDVDPWLEAYTEDVAREPVYVRVEEVIRALDGGPAGTNLVHFRGEVVISTRNAGGDRIARFDCSNVKNRLDVSLGLTATHQCPWRLFGAGCLLVESVFARQGELAAISGKVVTISPNIAITSPTSPGGNVDRFWERGYLHKDGLSIPVMKWVLAEDPTRFILRDVPPSSWLLAGASSIKFVPGCHKTVEDCGDTWDNVEGGAGGGGFNGFGYAMLPYNPLYQDRN